MTAPQASDAATPPQAVERISRSVMDSPETVDYLRPEEVIDFLRHNWRWPLVGAILCAALTALAIYLLGPTYKASATLIVMPPRFASDLKPPTLTVLGYQRLLESDQVRAETRRRLTAAGVLDEGETLRLGEDVVSRIFTARRAEQTELAPIMEAEARSDDPHKAAAIANEWSRVFVSTASSLRAASVAPTLEVVEEQYVKEREELERLTMHRVQEAARYLETIHAAESRWDQKVRDRQAASDRQKAKLDTESLDQVEAYQAATRATLQDFAEDWSRGVATVAGAVDGGDAPAQLTGALQDRLLQILTLRSRLAQTPKVLALENSAAEELAWLALLATPREDQAEAWPEQRLASEELDPVHSALILRLSEIETAFEGLSADEQRHLQRLVTGLEARQQKRTTGLEKLMVDRALIAREADEKTALDLRRMERDRDREVEGLRAERKQRLDQLDREIDHQRGTFDQLAKSYNQARLARAEQDVRDVTLATAAVVPEAPIPTRLLSKLVLAAVAGLIAGLALALVGSRRRGPIRSAG